MKRCYSILLTLCILFLGQAGYASEATNDKEKEIVISTIIQNSPTDGGITEGTMSPYTDRPGHNYTLDTGDGWRLELTDALIHPDLGTIEVFNGGRIAVRCNDNGNLKRRIEGMIFDHFDESDGVYLFRDTNNGQLDKGGSENIADSPDEGYRLYTNVEWKPAFTHAMTRVEFTMLGRQRGLKGSVTFSGAIKVSYTESADYVDKKWIYPMYERDTIDVTINQNVVTEPNLAVFADPIRTQDITKQFYFIYRIEGEPVEQLNHDTPTQSSVNRQTGNVITGGQKGSFRIIAMPVPATEEASRLYLPSEVSYVVNVHGKRGAVNINGTTYDEQTQATLKYYKDVPVAAPAYKVTDPSGLTDLSQFYKMELDQIQVETLSGNRNIVRRPDPAHILGVEVGTTVNRLTFLPKDEYVRLYDAATVTIETQVLPRPTDAEAHVVLRSTELEGNDTLRFKRNSRYYNELVTRVYDNLGNDVSDYYDLTPTGLTYTFIRNNTGIKKEEISASEAQRLNDEHRGESDFDTVYEGDPIFITSDRIGTNIMNVSILRKPNAPAVFQSVTKDVTVIVDLKQPDIRFTPEKIVLRKGQTWSSLTSSRTSNFNVKAYVDIRSINNQYSNFTYTVTPSAAGISIKQYTYNRYSTGSWYSPYSYRWEETSRAQNFSNTTSDARWDIIANQPGTYSVKLRVSTSSVYSPFDAVTVDVPVEVLAKVTPTVTFSADQIVARHNQKIQEPLLQITDANGEDISSQYNVRYTAILSSGGARYYGTEYIFQNVTGTGGSAYSADGKINTGLLNNYEGTYAIRATLTPKNPDEYEAGSASYDLLLYKADWRYAIEKAATDQTYGRLYFTQAGSMRSGSIIGGVPGLTVQFGSVGDSQWKVQADSENKLYATSDETLTLNPDRMIQATVPTVKADQTVFDVQDIPYLPTHGSFVKFVPATDGILQADMLWEAGHTYVLIRQQGDHIERITYTPTETRREVHRFRSGVFSSYPGYFYDSTPGGRLQIYGINFIPTYLSTANDYQGTLSATAYLNWVTDQNDVESKLMKKGGLPWLTRQPSPYVTHYVEQGYGQYATVDEGGIFDLLQTTDGIAQGTHASTRVEAHTAATRENGIDGTSPVPAMHIRTYGKVTSAEDPTVYRLAWYDMRISGIPTYIVPDQYSPSVQEDVTSVPGITMTWGGWRRYDNIDYKYKKDGELYDILDSWKASEIDDVASETGTLEGYLYNAAMGGNSNAKDELATVYKPGGKAFDEGSSPTPIANQPFALPCRGDYVTFKPSKAGTLYIYLVQRGCVEWNGDDLPNPGKNNMIRWRPLYILDERGEGVKLKRTSSSEDYSSTMNTGNGFLTRSQFLCSPYTNDSYGGGKGRGYNAETHVTKEISNFQYLVQFKDGMTPERLAFLKARWGSYGQTQQVISLDDLPQYKNAGLATGGYALISKGYVRYTFDVLPGKTYYVFQTGSKMGFCGFAFDAQDDASTQPVTLQSSTTQSFLNRDEVQSRHADVTLTGKKLIKDQWNSLTLPFSMTEEQVQQAFGHGTTITVFDDVDEQAGTAGRIYFTEHRYQHIVAGMPCMVWPTFVDADGNALQGITLKHDDKHNMDYVDNITLTNVAIDRTHNSLIDLRSKTTEGYTMQGLYEVATGPEIHVGDYYMSWGTLLHSNGLANSGTFNAILRGRPDAAPAKLAMTVADFLGLERSSTPTGIDELTLTPATTRRGVYNLQGQRVADDVKRLSHGVYIVDGKKVIIHP